MTQGRGGGAPEGEVGGGSWEVGGWHLRSVVEETESMRKVGTLK